MRYIFYLILFTSALKAQTGAGRIELTPFIINSVILKDTTQIRHVNINERENMTMFDYDSDSRSSVHFLSSQQFSVFEASMWLVARSPKSKVYMYDETKPLTSKELRGHIAICDTMIVDSYDPQGNEVLTKLWTCDSISKIHNIGRIDFLETWYFNPASNMIEKEILGYSVWQYDWNIENLRLLFNVFRDRKAAEKIKKYMNY